MPLPDRRAAWRRDWEALGAAGDGQAWLDGLIQAYGEGHRHYHALQHLDECLTLLQAHRADAPRPAEVGLALWFHDAVYAPGRDDNEARSADLAARALAEGGVDAAAVQRVHAMVLATRHADAASAAADADTRLLLDIDLAILGAPALRFDEYERQVRAEYALIDDAPFAARRAVLLRGFLARPAIYAGTAPGLQREAQARVNLARVLPRWDALARGGAPSASAAAR